MRDDVSITVTADSPEEIARRVRTRGDVTPRALVEELDRTTAWPKKDGAMCFPQVAAAVLDRHFAGVVAPRARSGSRGGFGRMACVQMVGDRTTDTTDPPEHALEFKMIVYVDGDVFAGLYSGVVVFDGLAGHLERARAEYVAVATGAVESGESRSALALARCWLRFLSWGVSVHRGPGRLEWCPDLPTLPPLGPDPALRPRARGRYECPG